MGAFEAAVEELRVAGIGFVNAVIRTVIAGRVTEDPPVVTYVKPDAPENLAAVPLVSGSTFVAAYCDPATSNDEFPVIGYRWYVNDVPVRDTSDPEFVRLGLTPSTAYRIRVAAFTVGAVSDLSDEIVITTDASGGVEPEVDTTPPSAPVLTSVTADTPNAATAVWTASTDNVGVAYYIMQIDGQDATAAYSPTLTASWGAFSQGRAYDITIVAVDGAGNRSAPSNVVRVTMPGIVVEPPAPRTLAGTTVLRDDLGLGVVGNVGPAPAARSLDGAATLAGATSSGSVANVAAGGDLPPEWLSPSVDTTYSFNEGDTVNITLDAADPEGNPIAYNFQAGELPANVTFTTAQGVPKLQGVIATGEGGYPDPLDYDSYYNASDVVSVTPVNITTTSLPAGQLGQAYSTTLTAADGYGPPYFWALTTVLPGALATEISLNPSTGVLSGTPSVTFSGQVQITATDPQSNVATKTFSLTFADVDLNDFPTRAPTAGTLYATNFRDVYLGNGSTAAVLTPARQITTTADLFLNSLDTNPFTHTYTTAQPYGQGGAGPYADGTARAELDTTTFTAGSVYTPRQQALRLPGRTVDDANGGDWRQRINGASSTLYRRLYMQVRVLFDEAAIGSAWQSGEFRKLFVIGDSTNRRVHFGLRKNTGALHFTWNSTGAIGAVPGAVLATNPWGRPVYRLYNQIDEGSTSLSTTPSATNESEWLQNYGPLQDGYDFTGYEYDAANKLLGARALPRGFPDTAAFANAPAIKIGEANTIQVFLEHVAGVDFFSLQAWMANESNPTPVCVTKSIQNLPLPAGQADNLWRVIQLCDEAAGRVVGTALERNTWFLEVQTSTAPIPFPGGFLPPDNQG